LTDLAQTVRDVGGWNVPVRVTGAYRVGDVRHAIADTTRARQLLRFAAKIPLEEGIRRWMHWAETRNGHEPMHAIDAAAKRLTAHGLYRNAGS
jgi:dTDP-L-rhamnose 4-epimerase